MGVDEAGAQALSDSAARAASGSLAPFFAPRSVAVVGASNDPAKFGGRVFGYMLARANDVEGLAAHAVNPRLTECQGRASVPRIADIDGDVDLAILAVPAGGCLAAIEDCVAKGVRAAIVFTAGFAETGEAGAALQQRLAATARAGGVRLLGPNCIGAVSEYDRVAATFATMWRDGWSEPGPVSVVCQSGAFASYFYVQLQERGIGLARWCTTGNEADVDVADVIAHYAADPQTRVIVTALEGVRDGRKLVDALAIARAADKPVILLKIGRSPIGASAAQSHTGALAGEDRIFDAAVRDAGAIRCATFTEAIDVAALFAVAPRPAGRRIGIVSASGGGGIMIADRAEDRDLDVPELAPESRVRLDALLPGGSSRNPVDVTAMVLVDLDLMTRPIRMVAGDGNVDAVIAFLTSAFRSDASMATLQPALEASGLRECGKPVLLSLVCSPAAMARLHRAGFAAYVDPVHATDAFATMADWMRGTARRALPAGPGGAPPSAQASAQESLQASRQAPDDEVALLAHFDRHGVRAAPGALLKSEDEIDAAYARLGPRVVMKLAVEGVAHKTELGGVVTGIASPAAARAAWPRLTANVEAAGLARQLRGIVMQTQISGAVELLLGMTADPAFGPVLTVAMGGTWVELLDDTATALAPVDRAHARRMLMRLRAWPLLAGARGRAPADVDAAADAIAAFSRAALTLGPFASIEINPLIVGAAGEGVHAADAKIKRPG